MSRVPDTAWPAELAADAQRVLTGWTAPTPADEVARLADAKAALLAEG